MKFLSSISDLFSQINSENKKNLILSALTIVSLYFAYPIMRSSTTAVFLDSYGAKKSPEVWIYSVIIISIVITLFSWLQKKWSAQALFFIMAALTSFMMMSFTYFYYEGYKVMAYPLYVWKEVYIVILVHLTLAYINNCIDLKIAKAIYGPLGAVGSVGGIVGGLVTTKISEAYSIDSVLYFCSSIVFLSGIIFWQTKKSNLALGHDEKKQSPLKSLSGVGHYVLLICLLVAITQFCINLANFKFNVLFEKMVVGTNERVSVLGLIYSSINGVSFFIQIILTPILMRKFSLGSVHAGIPIFLFFLSILVMMPLGASLITLSAMFIGYKAMDYSLFSTVKELLYFPLNGIQKYGAKYLADMLVYRCAKGLISAILLFIQTELMVNLLLIFFLTLWVAILIPLLKERKRLNQLIS